MEKCLERKTNISVIPLKERQGWSKTALEMGCKGGAGTWAELQLLTTQRKALFKLPGFVASPQGLNFPGLGFRELFCFLMSELI